MIYSILKADVNERLIQTHSLLVGVVFRVGCPPTA